MKLSIQACQALMMVLQHGLMEQISVVDILRDLEFVEDGDGLKVTNPPTIKFDFGDDDDEEEEKE